MWRFHSKLLLTLAVTLMLPQTAAAATQANQTQTHLEQATGNLQFDIADPNAPANPPATFKMGTDGTITLPHGSPASCAKGIFYYDDNTKTFKGCNGMVAKDLSGGARIYGAATALYNTNSGTFLGCRNIWGKIRCVDIGPGAQCTEGTTVTLYGAEDTINSTEFFNLECNTAAGTPPGSVCNVQANLVICTDAYDSPFCPYLYPGTTCQRANSVQ
jgi:hypothetical protein